MKTYNLEQRNQIRYLYNTYFKNGINPYTITPFACDFMSPIEYKVWEDIRKYGIKMYPQYPILNYFLDFGDPINKIGIEVDGKEYHKDKQKDIKRQKEIEKLGWRIYRFNGKGVFTDIYEYDEDYLFGHKEISEFIKNKDDNNKNKYINLMQSFHNLYKNQININSKNKPLSVGEIIQNFKIINYPKQEEFELFY